MLRIGSGQSVYYYLAPQTPANSRRRQRRETTNSLFNLKNLLGSLGTASSGPPSVLDHGLKTAQTTVDIGDYVAEAALWVFRLNSSRNSLRLL